MLVKTTGNLLIVDNDDAQASGLCADLELLGFTATCFTSAESALASLRENSFDLVLVDLVMPEMGGIAFLLAAFEIDPDLVGIVMTGQASIDGAVEAMQAGALDYVVKPIEMRVVLPVLVRALNLRRLRLETIDLQQAAGIYALSMTSRVTLEFDAILQQVADAAMGNPHLSGVSLLLPSDNGKTLRVVLARGATEEMSRTIPFTPVISQWVEDSLELRSHPGELSHVQAALPLSLAEMPDGTSLPMLAGSKFVGILHFTSENPRRPVSPGHIKALNILAGAAAAALEASSLLEQLRSAERKSRRLSEAAADVIFCYELCPQAHFTYMNPAMKSLVDYSPEEFYLNPDLILGIVHPDDRHLMNTVLRGDSVNGSTVTLRWVHRDGSGLWVELSTTVERDPNGRPVSIASIGRDITSRKNLEEQLFQSQKMEAIGLLAGGIAHDFNNLLTVILGYSDLILVDDKPSARIAEKIAQVKKAGDQAAALTRQLLAFGRRQFVNPTVVDLNAIVASSVKMLGRMIGEDIRLVTDLSTGLEHIKADRAHIEQILMNLVVNAKGAMPGGGTITIETRNVTRDEHTVKEIEPCSAGPSVMLRVTDTGCGMDELTQARIFEPFFTTKAAGMGTGLGLSIVYGIVKQSSGQIRVVSQPGEGATFEILFPRSEETPQAAFQPATPSAARVESETILVVEDDPGVRQLIRAILETRGYTILIAREGNDAVRICERHVGKIGLILTDLIMPGMGGLELVESLRTINPTVRVLFMSGYAGTNSNCQLAPGAPFIQKPFSSVDLIGKIREVLDAGIVSAMKTMSPQVTTER
jgi:PAS domain S-box-containing protein